MNLNPLVNLIIAADLGVPGESLFMNMMPMEAESAILLRNPLSGTKIDYELPGFYMTQFQLIVRSHSYIIGEKLIKDVIKTLTFKYDTQVEDHLFKYCRPNAMPAVFPLSKGNLLEFNVMMDVCFIVEN